MFSAFVSGETAFQDNKKTEPRCQGSLLNVTVTTLEVEVTGVGRNAPQTSSREGEVTSGPSNTCQRIINKILVSGLVFCKWKGQYNVSSVE